MPELNVGSLNKRLVIQTIVEAQNTQGEPIESAPVEATVWASIEPLTGRELIAAQAVAAEVTHRIRIRYRPGVIPKSRARFGVRLFDFQTVANVEEHNTELEIMAVERV